MIVPSRDSRPAPRAVQILLVEDNEIDVMAFRRSLKRQEVANEVIVAMNGREAIQILRGEDPRHQIRSPYLVFTDLNMPVMGGLEMLGVIRDDPRLDLSVVFILTTSNHERDWVNAFDNDVAGYFLKQDMGRADSNLAELIGTYGHVVPLT